METQRKLEAREAECGQPVEGYVRLLIEQDLAPNADMSFDQLLAPVRRDFGRSGMNEEELDQLLEDTRNALWRESQLKGR